MLINKEILTLFFIFLHTVTSSDLSGENNEEKQNLRRSRGSYKFHHPPAAEEYLSIPVAVVTDDIETRNGKSSKINSEIATKENLDPKSASKSESSTPKIEASTTKVETSTAKIQTSTAKIQISTAKIQTSAAETEISTGKTKPSILKVEPTTSKSEIASTSTLQLSKKDEITIQPLKEEKEDVEVKRKSKSENLFQIPVSIVYEPETKIQDKPKNKLNIVQLGRSIERSREERRLQDATDSKTNDKSENVKKIASGNKSNEVAANISKLEAIQKQNVISDIKLEDKAKSSSASTVKPEIVENKNDDTKNEENIKISQNRPRTRQRDPVVPIVDMENYIYAQTGEFHYSYEGGDGTKAFETGELKSIDDEKTVKAVSGGFSYKGEDGNDISLTYIADENGYRPVGAHLPTPPPIPIAIARALKYLATKTTPEPVTKPPKDSKPIEKDSKSSDEKDSKVSETGNKT